jgi:hypothetical protein
MTTGSLEERVRRLEDLEAIRDLMSRYMFFINTGWGGRTVQAERLREIFTAAARWRSADMALSVTGIDNIVQSVAQETATLDFSMHSLSNPILKVKGDRGSGNWLMWVVVSKDGQGRLVCLSFDMEYLRTDEGWRIDGVDLQVGTVLPGLKAVRRIEHFHEQTPYLPESPGGRGPPGA